MDILALVFLGVFPILMIVTGLHDLTTMRIPNWVSLILLAGFVPAALLAGLSPLDMAIHFGLGFAALLIGMAMFALRWVGGGDAKALAVACLWLGVGAMPVFLFWTACVGGVFCLVLLLARQHYPALSPAMPKPAWLDRLMEPKGDIPYGVAIAIGALMAFPQADMMARFLG